jgi:hypothetical protein
VYCIPVQCQYPATQIMRASGDGGLISLTGCGGGPLTAIPFGGEAGTASTTHPDSGENASAYEAMHAPNAIFPIARDLVRGNFDRSLP